MNDDDLEVLFLCILATTCIALFAGTLGFFWALFERFL